MTVEELVEAGFTLLAPGDERRGAWVADAEVLCEVSMGARASLYVLRATIENPAHRDWRLLLVRHRRPEHRFAVMALHHPEDAHAVLRAMEVALAHPEARD